MTDDKNQTVTLSCGLIHAFCILGRRIYARSKRLKEKFRLLNANWISSTIAETHSSLASRYCPANQSAGVYQSAWREWQCAWIRHVLRDLCLWECQSWSGMPQFHVYSLFHTNILLNAPACFVFLLFCGALELHFWLGCFLFVCFFTQFYSMLN